MDHKNPLADITKLTSMLGDTLEGLGGMLNSEMMNSLSKEQQDEIKNKMKDLNMDDVKEKLNSVDKEVLRMKDKLKDL